MLPCLANPFIWQSNLLQLSAHDVKVQTNILPFSRNGRIDCAFIFREEKKPSEVGP